MIPYGYKQTEIGVIPEDWDCVRLGEKAKIYRGGSPRPIQDYITTSSDGANWIKIGDVGENDKYIRSTQEKITPEGISKSREVHIGDFILSNSMSFGRPYILDIDGCIHDGWLTIQDYKNTFSTEYLYYLLASDLVYQQYIGMAAGSSVKNLNKDKVSALYVIYTAVSEQERIAEALSDVDELISSLEKLIAKKKAVKQGAMQELLTGKKRLPGFTGGWDLMELGKYGSLIKETINPQLYSSKYFWEYSMPAFDGNKSPNKQIGMDMHSNRTVIDGKVLLFNKLNVRQKRIWLVEQCRDNAVCSSEFLAYRSNVINLELLVQILNTDKVTMDFVGMSTGTSNSQKRIIPNDFLEYKVYLPLDKKEQEAIADVFSSMDNEIEDLEQKLAKILRVKQGMMQQLLTGKIRLV